MHYESIRDFCLGLPAVVEELPFDEITLVMKVKGKMFALLPLDNPETQVSLKCDPEWAIQLREQYNCIRPAYHFNKKHWNSVYVDPAISEAFMRELILHSYQLVVNGLPKALKKELDELYIA